MSNEGATSRKQRGRDAAVARGITVGGYVVTRAKANPTLGKLHTAQKYKHLKQC